MLYHPNPLSDLEVTGQGHGLKNFMLKRLVKVFKSLYLLPHIIELVDTLSDVRYWSKLLHCNIPNPLSDVEVKVIDLENLL